MLLFFWTGKDHFVKALRVLIKKKSHKTAVFFQKSFFMVSDY